MNDALNQSSLPFMLDFIFTKHIFVTSFLGLGIIFMHLGEDIYSFMHFCMISNAFRCIFFILSFKSIPYWNIKDYNDLQISLSINTQKIAHYHYDQIAVDSWFC